jgi:hypothetical protein
MTEYNRSPYITAGYSISLECDPFAVEQPDITLHFSMIGSAIYGIDYEIYFTDWDGFEISGNASGGATGSITVSYNTDLVYFGVRTINDSLHETIEGVTLRIDAGNYSIPDSDRTTVYIYDEPEASDNSGNFKNPSKCPCDCGCPSLNIPKQDTYQGGFDIKHILSSAGNAIRSLSENSLSLWYDWLRNPHPIVNVNSILPNDLPLT